MTASPDRNEIPSIEDIEISSPENKLAVVQEFPAEFAWWLLHESFEQEARLKNKNPDAPFIVYEPMNRKPQPWVAETKARMAAEVMRNQTVDSILFLPRSSTWERKYWISTNVFPSAHYPQVLREEQLSDAEDNHATWLEQPVCSYTKNRQEDGSRGSASMYFEITEDGYGDTVLLVDDALAQGPSTENAARALKEHFGVKTVYAMVTMAKRMEGGIDRLQNSSCVDGLIAPIVVESVDVATGIIFVEPQPLIQI